MNDRVFGVHCSNGLCEFDSHTTTKIYKIMNKEEMEEVLVELIENGELTEFQIKYMLTWIQGNGYVEINK
jgi:hypothetical protein